MAASDFLTSALSKDGSLAAVVPPSIARPGSQRVVIPIYHVTASSCQVQLTLSHSPPPNQLLREVVFCGNSTILARFGTSQVVVWDLDRGVVAHKFDAGEDEAFLGVTNGVGSMYYLLIKNGEKLYVHEYKAENNMLQRKIKSGKWEGADDVDETSEFAATHLCVNSTHLVVQASAGSFRVMDISSGKKVGKIKGNKGTGNDASTMVLLDDSTTLAVADNGGTVVLYNVETCKATVRIPHKVTSSVLELNSKAGEGMYNLLVDSTVYSVDGDSPEKLTVLKSSQPLALFVVPEADTVLALKYQRKTGCEARRVELEGVAASLDLDEEAAPEASKTSTVKRKASEPMMLGPGQAGTETAPPTKKTKAAAVEEKDEEEAAKDMSIAERLQQLTSALDEDDEDEEMDGKASGTATTTFKVKQATTESLKELLSQALQAGDDQLLELALAVRDVKVISNTIQELEPASIVTLLGKLTTRLASSPLRAESLALWLTHCLQVGRFQPHHMAPLRNLLYERIESFSDLLRLEGRLSMMCDTD